MKVKLPTKNTIAKLQTKMEQALALYNAAEAPRAEARMKDIKLPMKIHNLAGRMYDKYRKAKLDLLVQKCILQELEAGNKLLATYIATHQKPTLAPLSKEALKAESWSNFAIKMTHSTYGGAMICDTIDLVHLETLQVICIKNCPENIKLLMEFRVPMLHFTDDRPVLLQPMSDTIFYKSRQDKNYWYSPQRAADCRELDHRVGITQ